MQYHPELKTIGDFVRYAASSFTEAGLYFGHGTDNAWDEAIALVLPLLHLPQNSNPIILNANLTNKECKLLMLFIRKRIQERIPVAYLTHQAWFAGLQFYVDERVLIPRSLLVDVIEQRFEPWIEGEKVKNILDLCTGSGCIAIACAKAFQHSKGGASEVLVDASDISNDALAVAKINILRHEVEDCVQLIKSDLFLNLPQKKYDVIISNPPYVSLEEMSSLPREYQHEPRLGLEAGTNGLDFITRILIEGINYLAPHGILIVEVGNSEEALQKRFPGIPFLWLQFENEDSGVFLITAEELQKHKKELMSEKHKEAMSEK